MLKCLQRRNKDRLIKTQMATATKKSPGMKIMMANSKMEKIKRKQMRKIPESP